MDTMWRIIQEHCSTRSDGEGGSLGGGSVKFCQGAWHGKRKFVNRVIAWLRR